MLLLFNFYFLTFDNIILFIILHFFRLTQKPDKFSLSQPNIHETLFIEDLDETKENNHDSHDHDAQTNQTGDFGRNSDSLHSFQNVDKKTSEEMDEHGQKRKRSSFFHKNLSPSIFLNRDTPPSSRQNYSNKIIFFFFI